MYVGLRAFSGVTCLSSSARMAAALRCWRSPHGGCGRMRALMSQIHELRGKRLGCFCAPLDCHADIPARLANVRAVEGNLSLFDSVGEEEKGLSR